MLAPLKEIILSPGTNPAISAGESSVNPFTK